MSARLRAAAVHVLTATGAAFALLALIDAAHGDWQGTFIWLGVALIVDTIDGPLARRARVTEVLPRWSGERLDLIVDYLTYVGVPAFAFAESDLLPAPFRVAAGIAILLSSLFHMADLGRRRARAISSASPRFGTWCCSTCSPSCRRPGSRSLSSASSCC